nr:glutathione binding-like protein [Rhizobium halophytocola]
MAEHRFVVGDHLTLADIDIAAPFLQNARTKVPFSECPNLVAWQQRLLDHVPRRERAVRPGRRPANSARCRYGQGGRH